MFTLQISTNNEAFGGDDWSQADEVKRILEEAVMAVHNGDQRGTLRDSNGNTVGEFFFDGKGEG
jgi:hypothetical protein